MIVVSCNLNLMLSLSLTVVASVVVELAGERISLRHNLGKSCMIVSNSVLNASRNSLSSRYLTLLPLPPSPFSKSEDGRFVANRRSLSREKREDEEEDNDDGEVAKLTYL